MAITGDGRHSRDGPRPGQRLCRGVVAERTAAAAAPARPAATGPARARRRGGGDRDSGTQASLAEPARAARALRASGDPTLRLETRAVAPGRRGLAAADAHARRGHLRRPHPRRRRRVRAPGARPACCAARSSCASSTACRSSPASRARSAPARSRSAAADSGIGPRRKRRHALGPRQLSPHHARGLSDASRDARRPPAPRRGRRSVLVTGPSPSEGKTTTRDQPRVVARARRQSRDPDRGRLPPAHGGARRWASGPTIGIGKVLLGNAPLREALVPVAAVRRRR